MNNSCIKNRLAEIEKNIERAITIEEKNGSSSDAISYYEEAQRKIIDALKQGPIDAASQTKLKKYHEHIRLRIAVNKDPSRKPRSAERIFLTGKEFYDKFSPMLKNHNKKLIEEISYNITQRDSKIAFEDIAGNELAKSVISESIILPALRPELFTGLRRPAKGILFYGPPGNGKTLLSKAIANQCNSTFFCISAASLMDKYVGESEKLVAALFACARVASPSIIFIDEVEALLANRNDSSNQVQFRLLTQFLTEIDGVQSGEDRVIVLAATNHPEILDEAALRRFPKRIYIGQPDGQGRKQLLKMLLKKEDKISFKMNESDIDSIVKNTEGFSSSDLTELVKDAAMGPIRSLNHQQILRLRPEEIRPVTSGDFYDSLRRIRPSVNPNSLKAMHEWRSKFGDGLDTQSPTSSSSSRGFLSSLLPRSNSNSPTTHISFNNNSEKIITIKRQPLNN